ncbi:hypothetical protein SAMN05443574_103138 [Haloarcula vallismortis]|uniref:DUF2332 domain-containing protein n=2 Tax=Haloarcula vallismortis TaxID=28442 RepID=M0JQM9_HALVA|nr:DUF2332 domain-containing protein [Haloarcula vallismortis]EMA11437.1 hypothetical protein C437_00955 [Haloarcula vallismortis ATCC 29715]SDW41305.1 hypothetical protein SAMN05443574_103138 [Haloarcula vallismortis]
MPDRQTQFWDLATWAEDTSPLYAYLCREAAADDAVLDLASAVPEGRQAPHLLLAAVHYLLDRNPDHRLAQYYPSIVADSREPDDECFPAFREFCLDHADDIRPLLRTRRTQTNAVRRSAVLYPAIAQVARAADGPLALVELGPSAGLNLLFDRYRYDYDGHVVGNSDSPVTIESSVRRGDPPLPETPPVIRSRVGIDRNPLDVTDAADRDWLRALIWPEHEDRRAVLDSALAVARDDPPELIEGDMLDDLPAVLDGLPTDVSVCVVNTLVLYQVPEQLSEALSTFLEDRMTQRPLHWLTGQPDLSGGESVGLDWKRRTDDGIQTTHLVDYEPHGAWLSWLP